MDYFNLKILHVLLALTSISSFVIRWFWMKSGSIWSQHKLTRILPHIIDTAFLATGIWLAWTIQQFPFVQGWLTAKILGLVTYIILGSVALRKTASQQRKTVAFVLAIVVFVWIVSAARLKSVWGFLSLLV